MLKQDQYKPMPVEHQVAIIFSGVNGYLDKLDVKKIGAFEKGLISYITSGHPKIFEAIRTEGKISDETQNQLKTVVPEFVKTLT